MATADINLFAVLIAGILNMVIGAVWYRVWAQPWMRLINKTEAEITANQAQMGPIYGAATIGSLIIAYVLAHFISYVRLGALSTMLDPNAGVNLSQSLILGLQTGFWAFLGFVATTFLTNYLFADRPLKLYFIDACYYLVSFPLMGALLAIWQ